MSAVTIAAISGIYRAQARPSSFLFGVRHSGVFWYRGSLSDVTAALRGDAGRLALEGSARVPSISVAHPAALREHLLGPDFFDIERHPEITFRSTRLDLNDDRSEVRGELTMRGVTRPITAFGQYAGPSMASFGEVLGLELHTSVDRRDFGMEWQMQLPGGGDALGWDVEIDIDLLFVREELGDGD